VTSGLNFLQKFVKGYSKITNPLNKLLAKDTQFKWTAECHDAFECLKTKLTSAPILAYLVMPSLEIMCPKYKTSDCKMTC
jgi:hypothetical protein